MVEDLTKILILIDYPFLHFIKDNFYISQRAANTIIADITPFRISPEALAVINHFLDEFLYLLVDTSCSLYLENIKLAIFNVLPTHVGKNSIKEADFELNTFLESGNFDKTLEKTVELSDPYPVQRVFEQFRIKCKYYSTLSEQNFSINDCDPSTVPGLHNSDGIYISPSLAIYVTAVLEYVGEHILVLVAKTLKQGDVTVAKANEVYLALTDSQVLPVFQRTSLKEKMEETLPTLPKSPDSNISLSPISPQTPLSANVTDGNIMFRSLEVISPSSPIKDGDVIPRFAEAISPSSPAKVGNITFRSPEAILPSIPTKDGDIISQSPETAVSSSSPNKLSFRNEVGGGPRKGSVDSALWNNSSTKKSFGRTSLESKNVGVHSPKKKFKERDIRSISSLDDIDKAISFEHLISNNQNLTLKVSLTSNRMKTIETQKQEPRKFEPREPVARERLIPSTNSKSQKNEEDDDIDEFMGLKKKPKESLFEFLKNSDPDSILNQPTGKLKRKDSKIELLQKRLFSNKSGSSSLGRSTTGPSYHNGRPRHIPLIPTGRLSTSDIRLSSSYNTSTLYHSKSLDQLSTLYKSGSIANNNTDNLYNRQKQGSGSLDFNDDDYSIINYEKPSKRFDTQDLIDFLNTSSPPSDTFSGKKEKIFTKLLSKLKIPTKGKYNISLNQSNSNCTLIYRPKHIKIQIPETLLKEGTQEQVIKSNVKSNIKSNSLPIRSSSLKARNDIKHGDKIFQTNNLSHTHSPLSNNDSISKSTIVNDNNNGDVSKTNIINNNNINIISTTNNISSANIISNASNNRHSKDISNINNKDVDVVNDKDMDSKNNNNDDDVKEFEQPKQQTINHTDNNINSIDVINDKVIIVDDKDDRDVDSKNNNNDDDEKESEQSKQQTINHIVSNINNSDVVDDKDMDNKNNNNDDDTKESEQSKQQTINHIVDNFLQDVIFMGSVFEESNDESEQKLIPEFTELNEDDMDEILVVEWLLIGSGLVL
ncbi:22155_t:CDS:2 [Dentiscutata erythropus]|uniref:22155_t:CDS:1 n=1 Tax=Dentiscutata erythropus TaxID=1348616 RepID=A0A9N9FPM2_9GLOM|nr:22155_t:CDS:2 [Dentiscutata erythropus]